VRCPGLLSLSVLGTILCTILHSDLISSQHRSLPIFRTSLLEPTYTNTSGCDGSVQYYAELKIGTENFSRVALILLTMAP